MLSQHLKNTFEVTHMLRLYLALHHYVVYVDFNILTKLRFILVIIL